MTDQFFRETSPKTKTQMPICFKTNRNELKNY